MLELAVTITIAWNYSLVLAGLIEIYAVLSLLKKVPGPFTAPFLFFTRNNRQIMPQIIPGAKTYFVTYRGEHVRAVRNANFIALLLRKSDIDRPSSYPLNRVNANTTTPVGSQSKSKLVARVSD